MHSHPFAPSRIWARLPAAALAFWAVLGAAGCAHAAPFALGGRSAFSAFPDAQVAQLADAACKGDAARVASLARSGANVNGRGQQGITPLIWAMTCHNPAGLQALLQAGANPNLPMAAREINDRGVRHWELAEPDCTNEPFQSHFICQPPVYLAAGGNDPTLLSLLLDRGGNPNARDQNHDTALMNAVSMGRMENMKRLLAHGADVNYRDGPTGMNVLLYAKNRFDMVLYMVQHAHFTRANLQQYADLDLSKREPGAYGFFAGPSAQAIKDYPPKAFYPEVVAYFKTQGIVPYNAPQRKVAPPPDNLEQMAKEQEEFQRRADEFMERERKAGRRCDNVTTDSYGNLYCIPLP